MFKPPNTIRERLAIVEHPDPFVMSTRTRLLPTPAKATVTLYEEIVSQPLYDKQVVNLRDSLDTEHFVCRDDGRDGEDDGEDYDDDDDCAGYNYAVGDTKGEKGKAVHDRLVRNITKGVPGRYHEFSPLHTHLPYAPGGPRRLVGLEVEVETTSYTRRQDLISNYIMHDTYIYAYPELDGSLSSGTGVEMVTNFGALAEHTEGLIKLMRGVQNCCDITRRRPDVGLHINVASGDISTARRTLILAWFAAAYALTTQAYAEFFRRVPNGFCKKIEKEVVVGMARRRLRSEQVSGALRVAECNRSSLRSGHKTAVEMAPHVMEIRAFASPTTYWQAMMAARFGVAIASWAVDEATTPLVVAMIRQYKLRQTSVQHAVDRTLLENFAVWCIQPENNYHFGDIGSFWLDAVGLVPVQPSAV